MHKNFLQKLDSCKCSDARILMTLLFFQELLHKLSEAKFSFDKNPDTTSVTFVPFYINDHFSLKVTNANTITLSTKQSFEIKEMASLTLDLGLILGFAVLDTYNSRHLYTLYVGVPAEFSAPGAGS